MDKERAFLHSKNVLVLLDEEVGFKMIVIYFKMSNDVGESSSRLDPMLLKLLCICLSYLMTFLTTS